MQIKRKLTEREQKLFRILADQKNKTIKEISDMINNDSHDLKSIVDTVADEIDLSTLIDQNKDVEWAVINNYNNRLKSIEEAMSRLAEGRYGFCENCDQLIPEKRLEVLPFARYCINCQKEKEKAEK